MKKYFLPTLCALLVVVPSVSMAALITSVDRATFQAAIAGGTISGQNFDSLVAGSVLGATPDLTYSASQGSPIVTSSFLTSTSPNGLGSTSAGFFLPTETATFSFNTPITAFAIDINTFATSNGAYTASLNTGDLVSSKFEVFPSFATGQFIGFVSNVPFSDVTIAATTGLSYTLDTLVYGDAAAVTPGTGPVPEPSSIALLSLGFCAIRLLGRKKPNE